MSYTHTLTEWCDGILRNTSVLPTAAVAVNSFSKALLRWKGGLGSSRATSRLLQRDLFQVVLCPEQYQGCSGSNPVWGAGCSRDNSRWCSVLSNTREERL